MKDLIIYGTGLIGEVSEFTNAGEFIREDSFCGKPVVPFEELKTSHPPPAYEVFIALGYAKTNRIRQARYLEAKEKGYACATYVSSRATCFSAAVGENCFILENNVVQPFVTIGNNVTLWSGNHIGHDHCFVSSHVVISGSCDIGENCFLGVNSTLRDNIKLGPFVVVSPGAVVMKDCEERTVVQPADSTYRVIKKDVL